MNHSVWKIDYFGIGYLFVFSCSYNEERMFVFAVNMEFFLVNLDWCED